LQIPFKKINIKKFKPFERDKSICLATKIKVGLKGISKREKRFRRKNKFERNILISFDF
jgi:hypothetical protein